MRQFKQIVLVALFVICGVARLFAAKPSSNNRDSLDSLAYFLEESAWQKTPQTFYSEMQKKGCRFVFADDSRKVLVSNSKEAVFFDKIPVFETRIYWKDSGLDRVELSLYNKGDAEVEIREADFFALVKELGGLLDSKTATKGTNGGTKKPAQNKFVCSRQWTEKSPLAMMEWAYSEKVRNGNKQLPFAAEYIRIVFAHKSGTGAEDKAALTGTGLMAKRKSMMMLRKDVVRDSRGDVYIDGIPMVDQGQKGYCAASSAERVLRHYGFTIDQHQVAQLAETGAKSGTSFEGFTDAIEKIGKQFSMTVSVLLRADSGGKTFEKSSTGEDLEDYNKAAKRLKSPTIDWHDYTRMVGPHSYLIDVSSIWGDMDPEVLLAAKKAQKQKLTKFQNDVMKQIDAGTPIIWSCLVGFYPEIPDIGAQGVFGHMRLIIGYNTKKKEILYSDSWGGEHALKRLPIEQAWAMTKGLIILRPRN